MATSFRPDEGNRQEPESPPMFNAPVDLEVGAKAGMRAVPNQRARVDETETRNARTGVNSSMLAVIAFIGVVGVSIVGIGSIYARPYWDFGVAAGEMPAAIARAKELKMPLVASELIPGPPVSDAENAAPQIRALEQEMQAVKSDGISKAQKALSKGDAQTAKEAIAPFGRALAMAESASRKPRVDFGRDWDLGPNLLFPEYASLKSAMKLLCVRAEIRARTGNIEGALSDIRDAGMLSKHAGAEPILIASLVGIACEAIRNLTIERIAAVWANDPAKLERLSEVARTRTWKPNLGFAMRGEEYMGVSLNRNMDVYGGERALFQAFTGSNEGAGPLKVDPRQLLRSGTPSGTRAQAYFTRNLQLWESVWPDLSRPNVDPLAASRTLDRMAEFASKQKGLSYTVSKILFPVFNQTGISMVRLEAHNRATASLLKVLEYKARNGGFPKTLDQAGAQATDPFDGEPLRYRITPDGVRVYSVAEDLVDNGGMSKAEMSRKSLTGAESSGDEVAAYPPIAKKY